MTWFCAKCDRCEVRSKDDICEACADEAERADIVRRGLLESNEARTWPLRLVR